MPDRPEVPELSRRVFLQRVGAASLAVTLAGANALAQAPTTAAPAKPDSAGAPPVPAAAQPPSEDALALTAMLQRRFPDRLTREQWEGVTRSLDGRLESGRRLRAAKLANGDEPDITFRA